jgi:NADPH2:quinone reductase
MAPRGRLAVVGFTSGTIPSVKANYLLLKGIAVTGVNWGQLREVDDPAAVVRIQEVQHEVFDLLSRGKITSPVTASFDLADAATALTAFETRQTMGKIVLTTRSLR